MATAAYTMITDRNSLFTVKAEDGGIVIVGAYTIGGMATAGSSGPCHAEFDSERGK
jgi:hypothetical protein